MSDLPAPEASEVEEAPPQRRPPEDVMNPSEMVEMYHPGNATVDGKPLTASASRGAFDELWSPKGWELVPDPYAPSPEQQEALDALRDQQVPGTFGIPASEPDVEDDPDASKE